jgi:hypothetical protein
LASIDTRTQSSRILIPSQRGETTHYHNHHQPHFQRNKTNCSSPGTELSTTLTSSSIFGAAEDRFFIEDFIVVGVEAGASSPDVDVAVVVGFFLPFAVEADTEAEAEAFFAFVVPVVRLRIFPVEAEAS